MQCESRDGMEVIEYEKVKKNFQMCHSTSIFQTRFEFFFKLINEHDIK